MARNPNRRQFLQTTAAVAGVGFFSSVAASQDSKSPNERIRFASIGIGVKGSSDSSDAGNSGDMVAICDIDDGRLNNATKRFEKAKKYNDYRKLFDESGKDIDAVTVSTPDHMSRFWRMLVTLAKSSAVPSCSARLIRAREKRCGLDLSQTKCSSVEPAPLFIQA